MKFILKHGKSEKDIHNLRQEIEVLKFSLFNASLLFCDVLCEIVGTLNLFCFLI